MAPEQAKGKSADKRADIWAFGCVVFEMLTGRRAFDGEDVTETLASIIRGDAEWSRLPPATPPPVRTLLRRCLEKDPRERLPDIGAARLELREARVGPPAASIAAPPAASRLPSSLPWLIAAAAAIVAVAAVARSTRTGPVSDTRVFKSLIVPPSALSGAPALRLQVSPDGRRLAFVAADDAGRVVLWVRPLDGLTAQPLAGTTNASSPVWSPDSRWIAYQADGKLKKIDTAGGAIVTIASATQSPPGAWSKDNVILFSGSNGVLHRVPADGGTPIPVTRLGKGERIHISPSFLPDGRHFVYSTSTVDALRGAAFVAGLDSLDRTQLFEGSTNVMYADGHLLFVRDGNLMAQRFDADARTLSGAPIPLAEGVQMNPATGTGAFSVSQNGVLVFQTGTFSGTQLVLYDRAGRVLSTPADARSYRDIQMSPDGRFACVTVSTSDMSSVWIVDLGNGQGRPMTFSDEYALSAVWTPDGRSIVYAARRGGALDVYRRPASGNGAEELLLRNSSDKLPMGFTPDSTLLLYRVPRAAAAGELWLLPMVGDRTPRPFAKNNSSQVPAEVSPDGKWLAYVSDESTRREVYVTSFPAGIGKWLVSSNGGDNPRWRADGRELFYTSNNSLIAVNVTMDDARFETGPERALFSIYVPAAPLSTRTTYAASADGQRFLVNTWDPRAALTPITLVVNWTQTLAR
jgi:Tol biopolymer transport system component